MDAGAEGEGAGGGPAGAGDADAQAVKRARPQDAESGSPTPDNGGAPDAGDEAEAIAKRRRTALTLDDGRACRIRALLVRVGQKALRRVAVDRLEKQVQTLAQVLALDVADPAYAQVVAVSMVECACSFGTKAPVYAALTAMLPLNGQADVVDVLHGRLESLLRGEGVCFQEQPALALRFFAALATCGVVSCGSVVAILQACLEKGHARSVLHAAPWMPGSAEVEPLVEALTKACDEAGGALADEWAAAKVLVATNEDSRRGASIKTRRMMPELQERYGIKKAFVRRDEPPIEVAAVEVAEARAPVEPPRMLALFKDAWAVLKPAAGKRVSWESKLGVRQDAPKSGVEEACAAMNGAAPEEAWLLERYVTETLVTHYPAVDEARDSLLEVLDDAVFLQRELPVRHDYLAVQMCLSVALSAPRLAAFVHLTLASLFKAMPRRFGPVIEDAIDAAVLCVPTLPAPIRDGLASWTALQLSWTSARWPWQKWDHIAELPEDDARRSYVQQLLERLVELTLHDTLAPELSATLRDKLMLPPRKPHSALNEPDSATPLADWREFMAGKPEPEEVREWVDEYATRKSLKPAAMLEYVVHACLDMGEPSFTHTSRELERARKVIDKLVAEDPAAHRALLASCVVSFWQTSWQWQRFVLLHLVHVGLLSGEELARFLVGREGVLERWQVYPLLEALLEGAEGPAGDALPAAAQPKAQKLGAFGAPIADPAGDDKSAEPEAGGPGPAANGDKASGCAAVRAVIREALAAAGEGPVRERLEALLEADAQAQEAAKAAPWPQVAALQ